MVHDQAPLMVRGGMPTDLAHQHLETVLGARRRGFREAGIQFVTAAERDRRVRLIHAQSGFTLAGCHLAEHLHRLVVVNEDIAGFGAGLSNNLHVPILRLRPSLTVRGRWGVSGATQRQLRGSTPPPRLTPIPP